MRNKCDQIIISDAYNLAGILRNRNVALLFLPDCLSLCLSTCLPGQVGKLTCDVMTKLITNASHTEALQRGVDGGIVWLSVSAFLCGLLS